MDGSWYIYGDLDIQAMNQAACRMLSNHKDFASFCRSNTDVKTTLCNVTRAHWLDSGNFSGIHDNLQPVSSEYGKGNNRIDD